jgi:hypothetical protein
MFSRFMLRKMFFLIAYVILLKLQYKACYNKGIFLFGHFIFETLNLIDA